MSHPAHAESGFEPQTLVGATLDGRYVLTAHLATGGMGAVFRARHVHLRKDVAVKVLRTDLTGSAEIVERFRREAEIASALEHDNIVRVTDFGRSEAGYLFLVMELLHGESLFERLRREGFLTPEQAVPILWQVCAALEAAHARGVVHRDLKPENVFLAHTGSGREVTKILDFGIAKIADPTSGSATQAGIVVGTPEYLSPEQAMGTPIDARADIYAVGLIAWRALAGRHPFKADDPRSLLMMQATRPVPPLTEPRPDLAAYPGLVAAVSKACAKEASARHQSALALKEDLAAALGPAFMMPPGATPAPSVSLSLSPVPIPERRIGDLPAGATPLDVGARATVPVAQPPPLPTRAGRTARIAALLSGRIAAILSGRTPRELARSARERGAAATRRAAGLARAHPALATAAAGALLALVALVWLFAWQEGRAAARARTLLAADRAAEARVILDDALEHQPDNPDLLLLRGRALHRLPGRVAEGIDAYASARAHGPLDEAAHQDLVQDLARERSLADRATRLLRDDAEAALPAILRAAATAPGVHRLRALTLARDLGAEERLDRLEAYGELLADPECDVRRSAARRLGEIGDPAALPRLRKAAVARAESKTGFFGAKPAALACGAADAEAAIRRIEAARLPGAPAP